jgi:hypothetical protein
MVLVLPALDLAGMVPSKFVTLYEDARWQTQLAF